MPSEKAIALAYKVFDLDGAVGWRLMTSSQAIIELATIIDKHFAFAPEIGMEWATCSLCAKVEMPSAPYLCETCAKNLNADLPKGR